jgi:hypothetical protein
MEAKLREFGGEAAGLPLFKLNPNPPAYHFRQFPKARHLVIQQIQDFLGGKSAIKKSLLEINPQ